MKHTPGPWKIEELTQASNNMTHSYISANKGWADSGMAGRRTVAIVGHWKDRPDPQADARLIARAPELLEALEEIYMEVNHATDTETAVEQVWQLARDAIAKAKS